MRRLSFFLAAAIAALAISSVGARADRVDAFVPLGKSSRVAVTAPGDVATAAALVPAGAGRRLRVTVRPAGRPALVPDVRLVAPSGAVVDVAGAGGSVRSAKGLVTLSLPDVPQAGLWRVEVRGAGGSVGAAKVTIRARDRTTLPATAHLVPSQGTLAIPFDAGANQAVDVTIRRAHGTSALPELRILDPNGQPLADGAFLGALNTRSGVLSLRRFRLPSFGDYRLVVSGRYGRGGTVSVRARSAAARPARHAPTASAGAPSDAEPSTSKGLDGSGSRFPSGVGTFQWAQVAGPPVTLVGASTAGPSFVAPNVPSSLGFELVVADRGVWSSSAPVTVEVGLRPLADAGRSQSVAMGAAVTLDASGSTSRRGTPMTYAWTQDPSDVPQVTLTGVTTAAPSFTAPSSAALLHFALTVDDGTLRSAPDSVTVRVGDASQATPDAGRPQSVSRMATVHLSALATRTASGALDVPIVWTQISGPAVTLADPASAWPSFTAPKTSADLAFQLTAGGATDRVEVFVRATENDFAPRSSGNGTQTAGAGAVTLSASTSSDADSGATLAWRWAQVDGVALRLSDEGVVAPTVTLPAGNESRVYAVQATDGLAYGPPDVVAVRNTGYSGKPVADAGADVTSAPLQGITLNGAGSRRTQGSGPITWRWRQVSAKDWFDVAAKVPTFDTTAASPNFAIPATLSSLTPRRTILFELIVNDGTADSAPDLVTVTITGLPPNLRPRVTAGVSDANPIAAEVLTLQATTTDDDGDPLTYRWTQTGGLLPLLLSSTTALGARLDAPEFGTYALQFVANDGTDDSDPATVTFAVDERPIASAKASPASILPYASSAVDGSASADPEGKALTYRWLLLQGEIPTFTGLPADDATPVWTAVASDVPIELSLVVNDGRQDSLPARLSIDVGVQLDVFASVDLNSVPYASTATLTSVATGLGPFTYEWTQVTTGSHSQDPVCILESPSASFTRFWMWGIQDHAFGASPSVTFRLTVTSPYRSKTVELKVPAFASFNNKAASGETVMKVVNLYCITCHSGTANTCPVNPGTGTSASNYALGTGYFRPYSVSVVSCASTKFRVAPGSAAKSYMIDVMKGASGAKHPVTFAQKHIDLFSDWIDQGALDN